MYYPAKDFIFYNADIHLSLIHILTHTADITVDIANMDKTSCLQLAMKTGRPVKLVYNRREDIVSSRTRHGMEIKIKTGVKKDGTILSQDMQVIINAGAYAGGTMSIVLSLIHIYGCFHAGRVRRTEN